MASDNEIQYAIMNGINFGKAKSEKKDDPNKVKTKARKKAYQTGSHKSGAAKQGRDTPTCEEPCLPAQGLSI